MERMFKNNIIVIVGESGSGKTTLANSLNGYLMEYNNHDDLINRKYTFEKIITTTTRPIRENEINGIDYNFVSKENFLKDVKNKEFIEYSVYNNWYYGTRWYDITDVIYQKRDDYICHKVVPIIVMTPKGLRSLKKFLEKHEYDRTINVFSVYLNVDRKSRLKKLIETRDDIDESIRRNISDCGMFDGIEDEVNFVLKNNNYKQGVETLSKSVCLNYMDFLLQEE